MHHAVERFLMDGSACIPRNCTDVGDQLMLLLTTGKREFVKMTVRTFLKQSVAYFGNDLAALRKIYGQVIGKRYQVPLPLTEQLTLVPFKVRKPIGQQGAHGWFVAEHIQGLKRRSKVSTTIDVDGGHDILCCSHWKAANNNCATSCSSKITIWRYIVILSSYGKRGRASLIRLPASFGKKVRTGQA